MPAIILDDLAYLPYTPEKVEYLSSLVVDRYELQRGSTIVTSNTDVTEWWQFFPSKSMGMAFSDRVLDLVREGYDLAILIAALKDSTPVARRLSPNRRVLCASPEYLQRRGTHCAPCDLRTHREETARVRISLRAARTRLPDRRGRTMVPQTLSSDLTC